MNLPTEEVVPGLRNKALCGLTCGTHSHHQGKVLDILHETALDSSHDTIDSVKASLEKLNHLHLEQMDNNTHLPGAQTNTEEVKFKAMQAEVKQLQSEVTKLDQDRSATSANGPSNKRSKRCYSCGAEGHFANDPSCPNCKSKEDSKPSPGPSILKNGSSETSSVQGSQGFQWVDSRD